MKRLLMLLSVLILGVTSLSAQTASQLNYCRLEVKKLEKEVDKYKGLLKIQNQDLMQLKLKIVDSNTKIKLLNHEKKELNKLSDQLMDLALKYEDRGNYREAMDIYRMLIKNFPTSLDAAASKIKVSDLKNKQTKKYK